MGCDIHCHIEEFTPPREGKKNRNGDQAQGYSFGVAHFVNLGRNYRLFALMAGVRNDPLNPVTPVADPKGVPATVAFRTQRAYSVRVEDQADDEGEAVTKETAQQWVDNGYSVWMNDDHTLVSGPDWHTASWLTIEELEKVQELYASEEFPCTSWGETKDQFERLMGEHAVMGESRIPLEVAKKRASFGGDALDAHADEDGMVRMMVQTDQRNPFMPNEQVRVEMGNRERAGEDQSLKAIIDFMKAWPKVSSDGELRLVFWFDN